MQPISKGDMKIIVAGGTGFIGNALVPKLKADGHQVVILRRPSKESGSPGISGTDIINIDLEKPIHSEHINGDAIINLVGIIREFPHRDITFFRSHYLVTRNLVDLAGRNRIGQFLQMSALGAKPHAKTGYEQTKYSAECYIVESDLNWTIFRPSIVIGPGSHLISLLTDMITKLPVVPVIGNGLQKIQPLNIDDVCDGYRRALGNERSGGRIFEFGGPEIITFDRMLDILGELYNHPRLHKWHQPIWLLRPIAALMERFRWFPLTNDQITMLLENSYTEDQSYFEHFGIQPRSPWNNLKKS